MKKHVVTMLAAASLTITVNPALATTFGDVQFWVGSGANQAALVIDWNDGKTAESLLWGYRWDGIATGTDMLVAVTSADPQLFAHLGTYAWGTATFGIGYDLNASGGFTVTPALSFNANGVVIDPLTNPDPDDARAAADAAAPWIEGWNSGFWGYSLKASESDPWEDAAVGASDRLLSDGAWDGYSFAPGFTTSAPSEPVAAAPIPEPTAAALLMVGTLLMTCLRRDPS